MKIVEAVGWYLPESLGGTELYVAALAESFRAAGHEVLVAAPEPGGSAPRTTEFAGVPVFRFPTPAEPSRAEVQSRAVTRGAEVFADWLAAERPDVVHFHTFVPGLGRFEVQAAGRAGARVFATTHASSLGYTCLRGTLMLWGTEPCDGLVRPGKCAACALTERGLPRLAAQLLATIPAPLGQGLAHLPGRLGSALGMSGLVARNRRLQAELLDAVERFVVLTEGARQIVLGNGAPAAKVVVNRLGIVDHGSRPKAAPDVAPTRRPVRLGYLGRFDPVKGVHDLARAIAATARDTPFRLEFRGPVETPAERQVLREVKELLHGDPRVHFLPAVAPDEVPGVLAHWDVLVCPSVCAEGGPTVALEAFAVGTPVVGTRIGGLAELVEDSVSGRLFAPGDWRELSRLLAALATSPASTVDRWRGALPVPRTMADVARDYLELFTESGT